MSNEKGEKTKSPFAPGIVRVEVLDKVTRERYGEFRHLGLDVAQEGEAKGLWRILPDQEPR
jgi:hypothetical protein